MKTYGEVRYNRDNKRWVMQVEPHVAIRMKRVFARIDTQEMGTLTLSDTLENCRELLWFMERYPLKVTEGLVRLQRNSDDHRERTSAVERMLSMRMSTPAFELAIPPREYQKLAAAVTLTQGGLLLADDVGLGKTVSAITCFADPRTLPVLVVTLTHLPPQWKAELARFAPNLKVHVIKQGKVYDITERKSRKAGGMQMALPKDFPDVVIINYHKLAGWAEHLAPLMRMVVYDECQELRRTDSAKYSAALHISSNVKYRMGLSATPIYNYGSEIHSVINCIRPDALGTSEEFVREWCARLNDDRAIIKDAPAFGAYLRETATMLRRTRADVGRELPELTKIPHFIEADLDELDRVAGSATELAKTILAQNESYRGQKMHASEELSNLLRQATGIAKAPYVAEFVRLLVASGERVVLYGWHREVYSLWLEKLKDLCPIMYTGTESVTQKQHAKDAFLKGESQVLIMSLRSGAGLDGLQGVCRTVVFGELDWSPGVHEQCIGRVHRDGQGDKVVVYYLIAESGSDPVVAEALGVKKEQIDGIRNEKEQELVTKLQSDGGHIKRLAEEYLKALDPKEAALGSR